MNKEEYIEMFSEIAGNLWDNMMSDGSTDIPVEIVYTENYNGGDENKKLVYEKTGDSGFDLRAETNESGGYQIAPQGTIVIPCGIKVAVPQGTELQVRTRSGSPLKKGFVVANSPGTVDSGYRGVVGVICHNISDDVIDIECGERIAQGVICPVYRANFIECEELDETDRGDGAYNSTGVR
jgi:dUTP pyrophosphatase